MPNYKAWIDKLSKVPYVFGQCNCAECANEEPIDYHTMCADAITELYPQWAETLPRAYNHKLEYLNRDTNLRYIKYDTQDYWINLLRQLKCTNDLNKFTANELPDVDMIYCADCGSLHEQKELDGDELPICQTCFNNYYIRCNVCGELKNSHGSVNYQPEFDFEKWSRGNRNDIKRICRRCYVEQFMKCSKCRMPITDEQWINVSLLSGHRHETHVVNMMLDDEPAPDANILFIERPHVVVCPTCNQNAVGQCDRCGDDVLKWQRRKIRWQGDVIMVCRTCYEARRVIKAYDYAVRPKFRYAESEPTLASMLYYGVEIEMEYNTTRMDAPPLEERGQAIMDWWPNDFCYIKHDGTLEYGYEAVTHPFSWGWFMENRNKWIDFLSWLREIGFKAHYYSDAKGKYTCGLHVHMSKDGFSRMHLYKFVHFMYKKSTRPFINAIAERTGSQYADFQVADSKYAVQVGKDKKNASGKRHSAINLMGGHAHEHGRAPEECQTCEIRIFQGFLEPVKFLKNMEFLHSLYEFTAQHSPRDMQLKKYLEYLLLKPNRFPALLDFIKYNEDINRSYAYVHKLMKGV
ncbi:MAG: hypothetical protein ACXABY_06085 [Candidatus Thorarchaeota archaeon]